MSIHKLLKNFQTLVTEYKISLTFFYCNMEFYFYFIKILTFRCIYCESTIVSHSIITKLFPQNRIHSFLFTPLSLLLKFFCKYFSVGYNFILFIIIIFIFMKDDLKYLVYLWHRAICTSNSNFSHLISTIIYSNYHEQYE